MIIFELYNQRRTIQFATEETANSYLDRVQAKGDLLTGQEKIDYLAANILELRTIEVEDPIVVTNPDWQSFLDANDTLDKGGNGVFQQMLAIDKYTALDVYQLILRFPDRESKEVRTINFLYQGLAAGLSAEYLNLLKATIVDNHIPIVID